MEVKSYCRITNRSIVVNGKPQNDLQQLLGEDNVKHSLEAIFKTSCIPNENFSRLSKLSQLALVSADLAIQPFWADISMPKPDVGVLLFTRAGTMSNDLEFIKSIDPSHYAPDRHLFLYSNPVLICNEIAIRHNLQGELSMYSVEGFKPEEMFDVLYSAFSQDKELQYFVAGFVDMFAGYTSSIMCVVSSEGGPKDQDILYQRDVFTSYLLDIY